MDSVNSLYFQQDLNFQPRHYKTIVRDVCKLPKQMGNWQIEHSLKGVQDCLSVSQNYSLLVKIRNLAHLRELIRYSGPTVTTEKYCTM